MPVNEPVAVVAAVQTTYEPDKRSQSYPELVYEVVQRVLDEAGATLHDFQQVITASQDFYDGRTISDRTIAEACGSYLKAESKVCADGAAAVLYAALRIESGHFETALVVSHCKMSEGAQNVIANAMFDPYFTELLGLDDRIASALQARAYMTAHSVDSECIAQVAVKNLGNGRENPLLWRGRKVSLRDVLGSPVLADPIHELEAYPVSDGACALFLATRSAASRFSGRPVWLTGFGHTVEAYHLGDRDLARSAALESSARKAYRMAGISNPAREVHLVELTEYYAYQELLWTEALGLCEPGRGRELLEKGTTARQGAIPVNPSGGVLSGKPLVVAGMSAVADVVAQLRGEAGPTQTDGPRVGLVQAASGICGQGQTVLIFGTERPS